MKTLQMTVVEPKTDTVFSIQEIRYDRAFRKDGALVVYLRDELKKSLDRDRDVRFTILNDPPPPRLSRRSPLAMVGAVALAFAVALLFVGCVDEKPLIGYYIDPAFDEAERAIVVESAQRLNEVLSVENAVYFTGTWKPRRLAQQFTIHKASENDHLQGRAEYRGDIWIFTDHIHDILSDTDTYARALRAVAMHELAHAVTGAGHIADAGHVMSDGYDPTVTTYTAADIDEINDAYDDSEPHFGPDYNGDKR